MTDRHTALMGDALAVLAVDPDLLLVAAIGLVLLAVGWCALVWWGLARVRGRVPRGPQQATAALLALTLCAVVVVPLGLLARASLLQRDLVVDVFPPPATPSETLAQPSLTPTTVPPATTAPGATTTSPPRDPWAGKRRANILLLGSDAAPGRPGVRTDSVVLASIDLRSGRAVLFALPRNLQRARFPEGSRAAARFPGGYPGLLNEIYKYGVEHPGLVPGSRRPGVALIAQAVSGTLGQPVDHFFLADMAGFRRLVDALGGVRIRVEDSLPIGGGAAPIEWLRPGLQRLDGQEALWFARSRATSSDYDRMRRQRCLLGALARQADPARVLLTYDRLANAAKSGIRTDLPRDRLQALVALLPKSRSAGVSSVVFTPSLIRPSSPDVGDIRSTVRAALGGDRPAGERSLTSVCTYG